MKQIIINEDKLFLLNEELQMNDDLNGQIEMIVSVAYDAIVSLREGFEKYKILAQKHKDIFGNTIKVDLLNLLLRNWENVHEAEPVYRALSKGINQNDEYVKNLIRQFVKEVGKMEHPLSPYVTNWEPAKSHIENFKAVLACKITRMEVEGNEHSTMTSKTQNVGRSKGGVINLTGDENNQVKNRYYDLLGYQVSIYYIFNSKIPPFNEQNYLFNKHIKIYVNNQTPTKSLKTFITDKIYQTLSILNDVKGNNFDAKQQNIESTLPVYIKYLITNLWNKSFLDANASLANNTRLDSSWDAAVKIIECMNEAKNDNNEETWLKVGTQLSFEETDAETIKNHFLNETQIKYNELFNKIKEILPNTVKKQEQNERLVQYNEEPIYVDTQYGQMRIVMKNRNNRCVASIWMLKPNSDEMILKYGRAYDSKKLVSQFKDCVSAFDYIKGETIKTIIPKWVSEGFQPITDKSFEECQRIQKAKNGILENLRNYYNKTKL